MLRMVALLGMLIVLGSGCTQHVCIDSRWEEASQTLNFLNPRGVVVVPGTIYALDGGRLTPIAELLPYSLLEKGAPWITTTSRPAQKQSDSIGTVRYYQSRALTPPIRSDIELNFNEVRWARLNDPYRTMEILNRPITGLAYNREADARITLYRTNVRQLLTARKNTTLFLCTSTEIVYGANLSIDKRIPLSELERVVVRRFDRSGLTIKPVPSSATTVPSSDEKRQYLQYEGNVVTSCEMQRVVFASSEYALQPEFGLLAASMVAVTGPGNQSNVLLSNQP